MHLRFYVNQLAKTYYVSNKIPYLHYLHSYTSLILVSAIFRLIHESSLRVSCSSGLIVGLRLRHGMSRENLSLSMGKHIHPQTFQERPLSPQYTA